MKAAELLGVSERTFRRGATLQPRSPISGYRRGHRNDFERHAGLRSAGLGSIVGRRNSQACATHFDQQGDRVKPNEVAVLRKYDDTGNR